MRGTKRLTGSAQGEVKLKAKNAMLRRALREQIESAESLAMQLNQARQDSANFKGAIVKLAEMALKETQRLADADCVLSVNDCDDLKKILNGMVKAASVEIA